MSGMNIKFIEELIQEIADNENITDAYISRKIHSDLFPKDQSLGKDLNSEFDANLAKFVSDLAAYQTRDANQKAIAKIYSALRGFKQYQGIKSKELEQFQQASERENEAFNQGAQNQHAQSMTATFGKLKENKHNLIDTSPPYTLLNISSMGDMETIMALPTGSHLVIQAGDVVFKENKLVSDKGTFSFKGKLGTVISGSENLQPKELERLTEVLKKRPDLQVTFIDKGHVPSMTYLGMKAKILELEAIEHQTPREALLLESLKGYLVSHFINLYENPDKFTPRTGSNGPGDLSIEWALAKFGFGITVAPSYVDQGFNYTFVREVLEKTLSQLELSNNAKYDDLRKALAEVGQSTNPKVNSAALHSFIRLAQSKEVLGIPGWRDLILPENMQMAMKELGYDKDNTPRLVRGMGTPDPQKACTLNYDMTALIAALSSSVGAKYEKMRDSGSLLGTDNVLVVTGKDPIIGAKELNAAIHFIRTGEKDNDGFIEGLLKNLERKLTFTLDTDPLQDMDDAFALKLYFALLRCLKDEDRKLPHTEIKVDNSGAEDYELRYRYIQTLMRPMELREGESYNIAISQNAPNPLKVVTLTEVDIATKKAVDAAIERQPKQHVGMKFKGGPGDD